MRMKNEVTFDQIKDISEEVSCLREALFKVTRTVPIIQSAKPKVQKMLDTVQERMNSLFKSLELEDSSSGSTEDGNVHVVYNTGNT